MDTERVNTEHCHVTEDGQLVNSPPTSRSHLNSQRFKNFLGTCSTLPIPSSLTSVPPVPQYWETETAVGVKRRLGWRRCYAVLEVGVVEEDQLDRDGLVYDSPRSWCVMVGECDTHKDYCTQVWIQKQHVKCIRDTFSVMPGTSGILRYGVVLDTVRGRLGFVDVDRGVVLEKMDVDFRQTVYAVFAVNPYQDQYTVQMRLFGGSDIQMTEEKQKLIYSCLT